MHSEKSQTYTDKNHNKQPLGIIMEQNIYFSSCQNLEISTSFVIGILICLKESDLIFELTDVRTTHGEEDAKIDEQTGFKVEIVIYIL